MSHKKNISSEMLFSEWNEYWLSLVRYRLRITTVKRYEEAFESVIDPAFENRRICDITDLETQRFFNDLRERGMSTSRSSSLLSIARLSMDYALNRRLIQYNPFALVMLPRKYSRKTAILYDDDIRKMTNLYQHHHMMPMYMLMLLCGLRIGEAMGLTWDKVDMEKRTVEISGQLISYRNGDEQIYSLVPYTKNGESRILIMPELACRWLDRQKEICEELGLHRDAGNEEHSIVFPGENGGFMHYHQAYYQFKKIMEGIGREDVTLHSLRHTAATTVLYTTGDIAAQQRFLGHRSVAASMRYGGTTIEAQRRFADAIDAAFAEICAEGLGITLSDETIKRIREIQEGAYIFRSRNYGTEE